MQNIIEQQIMEGNKLIADFMEVRDDIPHDHQGMYLYHVSWDWLMPVVRKIWEFDSDKLERESDTWYAYWSLPDKLFEVNIEKAWQACVDFIKWRNENKNI